MEGAPDVGSSGKGAGLEEGSPRGWEHRPAFRAASGAKPQDEVGGAPRLPRAGFSLWTLQPLASGRSSEPPLETSGRWEGAGPLRSLKGGQEKFPSTLSGFRVGKQRGSGGPGALRPQVTRGQGVGGDAWPVPACQPKSEGSEGARIPSTGAWHSPGSAPPVLCSVQSRTE